MSGRFKQSLHLQIFRKSEKEWLQAHNKFITNTKTLCGSTDGRDKLKSELYCSIIFVDKQKIQVWVNGDKTQYCINSVSFTNSLFENFFLLVTSCIFVNIQDSGLLVSLFFLSFNNSQNKHVIKNLTTNIIMYLK